MVRLLELVSTIVAVIATAALLALAGIFILEAGWEIIRAMIALRSGAPPSSKVLDSIGLIVIAFAVIELSKFIIEEQVVRRRELRSAREARGSLTKFVTIIVIALSLEAIVMLFKANRGPVEDSLYSALLFAVAAFTLIGLGAYQWLSNIVEPSKDSVKAQAQLKRAEADSGKS